MLILFFKDYLRGRVIIYEVVWFVFDNFNDIIVSFIGLERRDDY